jgi:aspartate aminotransferase
LFINTVKTEYKRQKMNTPSTNTVAKKMLDFMESASWIRKMFEEGAVLKTKFGADRIFDFSLGNPDLPPPASFQKTLETVVADRSPGVHSYMPNAGLLNVRSKIATQVSIDQQVDLSAEEIIMTCGAAGGLNIIFKSILNPNEEIIVPTPYFVEYGFYADNHNGKLVPVKSRPDFSLDIRAIEKAVNNKTKAVLLNSPNNPSGIIYSKQELEILAKLLTKMSDYFSHPIFLISDEPYRRLVFTGSFVPPILKFYPNTILTTSFSKDLSIPGERIGYVAVHPEISHKTPLLGALTLANRILGFVNAPALMQRIVGEVFDAKVDIGVYQRRRDRLAKILKEAGYTFIVPQGTFYFFPRTPIPDDIKFVRMLQKERILTVPGSGFGAPGHFRIAFCVDDEVIERSREGFIRTMEMAGK